MKVLELFNKSGFAASFEDEVLKVKAPGLKLSVDFDVIGLLSEKAVDGSVFQKIVDGGKALLAALEKQVQAAAAKVQEVKEEIKQA